MSSALSVDTPLAPLASFAVKSLLDIWLVVTLAAVAARRPA